MARTVLKDSRWPKIADDLRKRVLAGEWAPGARIPSQRQLMEEYRTPSPLDVVRAVAALMAEGLLITEPAAPRRGARVRSRYTCTINVPRVVIDGYTGEAQVTADLGPASIAETDCSAAAPDEIEACQTFGQGDGVLRRRVKFVHGGTPHAICDSFMLADLARTAGVEELGPQVSNEGIIALLRANGIEIGRTTATLATRVAGARDIAELMLPRGAAVHEFVSIVRNPAGAPLEASIMRSPADRTVYTWTYDYGQGLFE